MARRNPTIEIFLSSQIEKGIREFRMVAVKDEDGAVKLKIIAPGGSAAAFKCSKKTQNYLQSEDYIPF